jgi:hypothetical protein
VVSRPRLRWPALIELDMLVIGSLTLLELASGLRSVASWF